MKLTGRRWFLVFNSIASQLLLLLVVALILLLGGFYLAVSLATKNRVAPPVMMFAERQLMIGQMLALHERDERQSHLNGLLNYHPNTTFTLEPESFVLPKALVWDYWNYLDAQSVDDQFSQHLPFRVGSLPFALELEEQGDNQILATMHMRMPDDQVFTARSQLRLDPPPNLTVTLVLVFVIISMALLLVWAIVFLIRPIRRIAAVTDRIARDGSEPLPVDAGGPTELRLVSQALSKMQHRIQHLLEDRTRMLAAVGHDLRTPVTRLRLRADTVGPDEVKDGLLRDIAMMDGLLSRLMSYFQSGSHHEEKTTLEFCSLVETLVSEWEDAGHDVTLGPCETVTMRARLNELMRMIDNLIDNAIKYGGSCQVSLFVDDETARLEVVDHGPGIPEEDRLLLLEPFTRGEKARTMDNKSGFGLGLAIAVKAAESHDATLELIETPGGGLTVHVTFPLGRQASA
ncbi:ATP-binding protein [uncultured Cohaesibacter sp.]|uniref:ATP-binding protein n=1 Tax=uncultured Cohaesibacter sp. TaxID=1002546 RepID=UPI0029C702F9|nr:ATP-binding protein [uncultured Cohaesibacter sp.]